MKGLPLNKLSLLSALLLVAGFMVFLPGRAAGAELQQRSLTLSDGSPGAVSSYQLAFTPSINASEIIVDFCSNSPLEGDVCTATGGTDVPDTSGVTAPNIAPVSDGSTDHTIAITGQTLTAGTPYSILISNVLNPSSAGSFYARVLTYNAGGAASYVPRNSNVTPPTEGSYLEFGGLALELAQTINVSAQVPPYIISCVGVTITNFDCSTASGDFNELGNLLPTKTSDATNQIVVATNAANGYSLAISGTTLTSGNNIIPAINGDDIARSGTAQFGINLRQNSIPPVGQDVVGPGIGTVSAAYDQPNLFRFVPGDIIASAPAPADNNKYTVSYIVNVPSSQPIGVYATTLTFVALANF